MVLGKNTECIPHRSLPQTPGGVAVKVGVLGSEGGWKEAAASVNFLGCGCGGCGSWVCTGLCRSPLGREGAELGVTGPGCPLLPAALGSRALRGRGRLEGALPEPEA